MIRELEQEKVFSQKKRNIKMSIVGFLFTVGAGNYIQAQPIQFDRDDEGTPAELHRVMARRATVSDRTLDLIREHTFGAGSIRQKLVFAKDRLIQQEAGYNVLEVQNLNSKPLSISLSDQDDDQHTNLLGVVHAGATVRFQLDRNTVYDTYTVNGTLGCLRSSVCSNLSFESFYIRIIFQKKCIGTEAVLDAVADIY